MAPGRAAELCHVLAQVCIWKLTAKSLGYEIFPYMNFIFDLGDGNMSLGSLWLEYITVNAL